MKAVLLAALVLPPADVNPPPPVFTPEACGLLRTVAPLGGELFGLAFSADGRRLVVGCGQSLRVYSTREFAEEKRLEGHPEHVFSVAVSPDGTRAAGGGFQGTVIVWNVDSGSILHRLALQGSYVTALAFSPDGRQLVAGSVADALRAWEVETGVERALPVGRVSSAAFSPDGRRLAAWDLRELGVWRTGTWERERVRTDVSDATHVAFVGPRHLAVFTPELATRWDVETGRDVRPHRSPSPGVPRAMMGARYAALALPGGAIRFWDLSRGEPGPELRHHQADVTGMAAHPSGRMLATIAQDRHLKIWGPKPGGMASVKPRGFCGIMVNRDAAGNIYVAQVIPNTPAAQAGLRPNDVLRRVGGREIVTTTDSVDQIGSFQVGEEVEFVIRREGTESSLRIRLGEKPKD